MRDLADGDSLSHNCGGVSMACELPTIAVIGAQQLEGVAEDEHLGADGHTTQKGVEKVEEDGGKVLRLVDYDESIVGDAVFWGCGLLTTLTEIKK